MVDSLIIRMKELQYNLITCVGRGECIISGLISSIILTVKEVSVTVFCKLLHHCKRLPAVYHKKLY